MGPMDDVRMEKLLQFLDRLERASIAYHLEHFRDSILGGVAVPGERWEVEFFPGGRIEIERFRSGGSIETDESLLDTLSAEHGGS